MRAKAQRKEKLQALRDKCEAEMGTSVSKLHEALENQLSGVVPGLAVSYCIHEVRDACQVFGITYRNIIFSA